MNEANVNAGMTPFSSEMKGTVRTYDEFMSWNEELVKQNATSGENQSEALIDITALNLRRMKRLNKTFHLSEESKNRVAKLDRPMHWWVFTEAWCGDSAQTLPVMNKLAEASQGLIEFKIVLRDENLHIMDRHRTNGGLGIPKLVALDDSDQVLFEWGARPVPAYGILEDWKSDPRGRSKDDFQVELHTWYAKDKGQTTLMEFEKLIEAAIEK